MADLSPQPLQTIANLSRRAHHSSVRTLRAGCEPRSASNLNQEKIEWSEWDEYAVLGNRRMDCIGRWESDRADREIASQRMEDKVTRVGVSKPGGERVSISQFVISYC